MRETLYSTVFFAGTVAFLYAFIYDAFALYTFHLKSYFRIRKLKVISISKAHIDDVREIYKDDNIGPQPFFPAHYRLVEFSDNDGENRRCIAKIKSLYFLKPKISVTELK
jgi:hypothetical protein